MDRNALRKSAIQFMVGMAYRNRNCVTKRNRILVLKFASNSKSVTKKFFYHRSCSGVSLLSQCINKVIVRRFTAKQSYLNIYLLCLSQSGYSLLLNTNKPCANPPVAICFGKHLSSLIIVVISHAFWLRVTQLTC